MALHYCPNCLNTFQEPAPQCPNLGCRVDQPADGWGRVLGAGDHVDRNYRVERALAVGGAGLTYLARALGPDDAPTGPLLAIKVLYEARASGAYLQRLATEAQILQELAHEHIVRCEGFVHRAGHEPYLVTRFEEGGSLSQHIERVGTLDVPVAMAITRQILLGLDTAHERGVVHRDLKPDNVLLSAPVARGEVPHCRVADFGIAKVAGGLSSRITKLGAFIGTPEYAAPEQFEQLAPSAATDVFAVGGLLWYMLTGQTPVTLSRRADLESSYEEVLAQIPPQLGADAVPEVGAINFLLRDMMAARSEDRLSIQQVLQRIRPWLEPRAAQEGTLDLTADPAPGRDVLPHTPRASTFAMSHPPVSHQDPEVPLAPAPAPPASVAPPDPAPDDDPLPPPPKAVPDPDDSPVESGASIGSLLFALGGLVAAAVAAAVLGFSMLTGGEAPPIDLPALGGEPQAEALPSFNPARARLVDGKPRRHIQDVLQAKAPELAASCDAHGAATALAITDDGGRVFQVIFDEGDLSEGAAECVAQGLVGTEATVAAVKVRVALSLPDGA